MLKITFTLDIGSNVSETSNYYVYSLSLTNSKKIAGDTWSVIAYVKDESGQDISEDGRLRWSWTVKERNVPDALANPSALYTRSVSGMIRETIKRDGEFGVEGLLEDNDGTKYNLGPFIGYLRQSKVIYSDGYGSIIQFADGTIKNTRPKDAPSPEEIKARTEEVSFSDGSYKISPRQLAHGLDLKYILERPYTKPIFYTLMQYDKFERLVPFKDSVVVSPPSPPVVSPPSPPSIPVPVPLPKLPPISVPSPPISVPSPPISVPSPPVPTNPFEARLDKIEGELTKILFIIERILFIIEKE